MKKQHILLSALTYTLGTTLVFAAETKGLLPEVRMGNSESENERKSFNSEILITQAENKAIDTLLGLIKQRKGAPEEADLHYRLAELYMRRSKSGRFFDLNKNSKLLKLSPFPVPADGGAESIRKASAIYYKIEKDFPKFDQMDSVLFNNAFANQQLGKIKESQALYLSLITKFPNSVLTPDGTLALAELLYDQKRFQEALTQFQKVEKYPQSRVYNYALYKTAWTYYNMHDSANGIKKLIEVVEKNPALRDGEVPSNRHNLRREALRDLTIFVGDVYPAKDLYPFFAKITEDEELGQAMIDLAKLYDSHSRQKEMDIFLDEYIEKNKLGFAVVKAHLMLVDANEMLKRRDQVVKHLSEANELCQKKSAWHSMQKQDTVIEFCHESLRRASLEIASKWWEIWLKNKNHKEFSGYTEQAFKIILDNEDPARPDTKTRYAYAELLFQQAKYEEASNEYKTVGSKSDDKKVAHDADYAALFSKEKSIEQSKEKDSVKEAERKALALNYLAKYPTGEHARSVSFKLGHIAYEENQYEEAAKKLKPIAESNINDDLKKKSEDLLLDILNIRKDYAGLQKVSKQILARTTDNARKDALVKINQEASFAEIQEFAKTTQQKEVVAQKLSSFAKENANSSLASEAMWQSLSLYYADGKICDAADMTLQFTQKYPNDNRNTDALKEAAKSFAECGDLQKSADVFLKLADLDKKNRLTHLEVAADMNLLEKKTAEARKIYNLIANETNKENQEKIYSKILSTFKDNEKNAEYEKIENKLLSSGIEPYATQILTRRAKALYDAGKLSAAFDLALKVNSRNTSADIRAEARMIQARILEKEFTAQSVKAKEDKFAMVLSLKTEKLDKAQTAYLSALKMTKDADLQLEALRAIDRCYANYIDSLTNTPLPATLSAEDQSVLRQELDKILSPIKEKQNENQDKLKSMAKAQGQGLKADRDYASLSALSTVTPLVRYPAPQKFKPFYLDKDAQLSANELEKKARVLVRNKETRSQGLYLLSISAESRNQTEKALWLVEQSLKMDTNSSHLYYQKARLTYQLENMASAKAFFDKVLDMKMTSTEIKTFAAIKNFSEGNFLEANKFFSGLKKEDIYNYEVGAIYVESFIQMGDLDKALSSNLELLQGRKDNLELQLELAHLYETYKADRQKALSVYESILKQAKQDDLKEWLVKKINALKKS